MKREIGISILVTVAVSAIVTLTLIAVGFALQNDGLLRIASYLGAINVGVVVVIGIIGIMLALQDD